MYYVIDNIRTNCTVLVQQKRFILFLEDCVRFRFNDVKNLRNPFVSTAKTVNAWLFKRNIQKKNNKNKK